MKIALAVASIAILAAGAWLKYDDLVSLPRSRASIAGMLLDPASAQFRKERIASNGWMCGEINSKNSFGGYVGFHRFISAGGAGPHFVEELTTLGELRDVDRTALAAYESKLNRQMLQLNYKDPSYSIPPEHVREQMAQLQMFKEMWVDICESKLPPSA